MSSEETLIQTRKDKHLEINGGAYPLADYCPAISQVRAFIGLTGFDENDKPTGEIKTSLDPVELGDNDIWNVHGRITNLRKSGALTFIKIADMSGSIQIIATRNTFPEYSPVLDKQARPLT